MSDLDQLWRLLVPLPTVNSFMNTGAHPDDEANALLAYLAIGLGVRTVVVCATRGEGGQNAIGPEQDTALGAVRTRELAAVARETGFAVYHLGQEPDDPVRDFGFSRTAADTLRRWGHQRALERLVRLVRQTRPDVLFTSFLDVPGQHGHHRAVTALTREAFALAGDPEAFPEHLAEGLRPWTVPKFYLPAQFVGATVYEPYSIEATLALPIGETDPVLGRTYVELGARALTHHSTQGLGQYIRAMLEKEAARREALAAGREAEPPRQYLLHLAESRVPVPEPEDSPFAGLPRTVGDLAARAAGLGPGVSDVAVQEGLYRIQAAIDRAVAAYPDRGRVAEGLHLALEAVRSVRALLAPALDGEVAYDIDYRLAVKEEQLQAASAAAVGLAATVAAETWQAVRGQEVAFTVSAQVLGPVPVEQLQAELVAPAGWPLGQLGPGQFLLSVPADAPYVHPYRPPVVAGRVRYVADGVPVTVPVPPPATFAVLPRISLRTLPERLLVNREQVRQPLTLRVEAVRSGSAAAPDQLRLELPPGWEVEPATALLAHGPAGSRQEAVFRVTPPADLPTGRHTPVLHLEPGGRKGCRVERISYPHTGEIYLVAPARLEILALSLRLPPGLRVGYVESGFDQVPEALREMGVQVDLLSEADLQAGDLSRYQTIMLGIRAYGFRPDLRAANRRLLDWVAAGGNLLVQYHKPNDQWDPERTPPYRIKLGTPSIRWRVTDPDAPVQLLVPQHPIFRLPNALEAADWQGWHRERGLYFASEWDPAYTPLLAVADPGEEPMAGGLLTARYGRGHYTFIALVLHYQLERQVPGAYRLLANLISLGQTAE